jgi:homocysteine S-methyltransferase
LCQSAPGKGRAICNDGRISSEVLPQLSEHVFIGEGGIETSLIHREGVDLPDFAAFPLLADDAGRTRLRSYYAPYVALAAEHDAGLVLDTPTWRANPDWGARLGYGADALAAANRAGVALLADLRAKVALARPLVVNGVVGPRGDGYVPGEQMSAEEAERYHAPQLEAFAQAGADLASALTLTYAPEAIGIARAARAAGLPIAISFTVETDGRLPSGQALREAVEQVDAETDAAPAYYMVNCAHPTHFADVLDEKGPWRARLRGIRANASRMSHAELDEASELDSGDPVELAAHYRALRAQLPSLTILGGCCGTDERHIAAICAACLPSPSSTS